VADANPEFRHISPPVRPRAYTKPPGRVGKKSPHNGPLAAKNPKEHINMNSRFNSTAASVLGAMATWLGSDAAAPSTTEPGRSKTVPLGDEGHIVVGLWAGTSVDRGPRPLSTSRYSLDAVLSGRLGQAPAQSFFVTSISFGAGSHEVEPHLLWELHHLAGTLARLPRLEVELDGHADSQGPRDQNRELSQRRGTAVHELLARAGSDQQRIISRAYGKLQARYVSEDHEGRSFDRRVLVRVTLGCLNHV